jgi:hypothetical protein
MSKFSRNRAAFPVDPEAAHIHPGVAVLGAEHAPESSVDASEAPETPETASAGPADAPETVSEAPEHDFSLLPKGRDAHGVPSIVGLGDGTITSDGQFHAAQQDDIAAKVAALLAEEDEADEELEQELGDVVGSGLVELPDGSVRIPVVIPQEMVEILRSWSEGAGQPFDEYLGTILDMALNAVVNGQAVAG